MAVSDAVVANITTIYVAVIAVIKAYAFICGRSFSGGFVLIVSTAVVGLILIATLTWEVSRKATYAFTRDHAHHPHEMCKGGICWHGVAVRSPVSQSGLVAFCFGLSLAYSIPHIAYGTHQLKWPITFSYCGCCKLNWRSCRHNQPTLELGSFIIPNFFRSDN